MTAIDADRPTLDLACTTDRGTGIQYVHADLLTWPAANGSFDVVCSIAALHHLDAGLGHVRMAELLRPGGRLVVVGLARSRVPLDVLWELGSVAAHRWYSRRRAFWDHAAPTVWPPPETYPSMRHTVRRTLPGCVFRRRPLWRYTLTWTKPPQ